MKCYNSLKNLLTNREKLLGIFINLIARGLLYHLYNLFGIEIVKDMLSFGCISFVYFSVIIRKVYIVSKVILEKVKISDLDPSYKDFQLKAKIKDHNLFLYKSKRK